MDERAQRWEERFEWPMVIAALLVIPVLVIEESNWGQPWDAIGQFLNWATWLAFVVEAVVMIRVSPRPWEWIKRYPIDVAVIFLSPPFIPGSLAGARLFRLLRVVRLLRIFSVRRLLSLEGIRFAAFLAVFVVLVGGMAYAAVEKDQNLTNWDGIWWAVTTVTTVGYGDSFPVTDGGRAIAMAVMAVGVRGVADRLRRRPLHPPGRGGAGRGARGAHPGGAAHPQHAPRRRRDAPTGSPRRLVLPKPAIRGEHDRGRERQSHDDEGQTRAEAIEQYA
jgi:voltage-gated potassium channel